jgi:hypothetical protein
MKTMTMTNQAGRSGVAIVAPEECVTADYVAVGTVVNIGNLAGCRTVKVTEGGDQIAMLVSVGSLRPVHGATVVNSVYQRGGRGSCSAYLLVARQGALVEVGHQFGGSEYKTVTPSGLKEAPVGVLVAAGLLEPEEKEVEVPEMPTAMEEALRKAGLL